MDLVLFDFDSMDLLSESFDFSLMDIFSESFDLIGSLWPEKSL